MIDRPTRRWFHGGRICYMIRGVNMNASIGDVQSEREIEGVRDRDTLRCIGVGTLSIGIKIW